jgi:OmcA/MtrC family decaheme c-type cytochrome
MLTGGLGYSYTVTTTLPLTQTNVVGYPTATATGVITLNMPNKTGGLMVIAPDAQVVASTGASAGGTGGGYSGRRTIVSDALCNKCHQELGAFTEDTFHAGQRNDGSTCAWCHTPNQASSGWTADSTSFVHGIHAAAKRTVKYTWHATSATDGFYNIGYPGILKKCETCHLPGTYDYSDPASAIPFPNNRQYRTVAAGTLAATFSTSPEVAALIAAGTTTFGTGYSFTSAGVPTDATSATLVNSPIATVCFACHTDTLAVGHMKSFGASLYEARLTALPKLEQCTLCHLAGQVADIKAMHAK